MSATLLLGACSAYLGAARFDIIAPKYGALSMSS